MSSSTDLNHLAPPRIPKLTIRNPFPPAGTESQDLFVSTDRATQLSHDPPLSRGSSTSAGRREHTRQRSHVQDGHARSKKKNSGVFGFLALKEPSTSAWEEYAEFERRKAAQRNSGSKSMLIPGVSSQKLPGHVPKVNSKWDGLPEVAKPTHRSTSQCEKPKQDRSMRASIMSGISGASSEDMGRYPGVFLSNPTTQHSQSGNRSETHVSEIPARDIHTGLLDQSSPRTHLQYESQTRPTTIASWSEHSEDNGTSNTSSPSDSEISLPQLLYDHEYADCAASSPETSPQTPKMQLSMLDMEHGLTLPASPHQGDPAVAADAGFYSPDDLDAVMVRTTGHDILRRPAAAPVKAEQHPTTTVTGLSSPHYGQPDISQHRSDLVPNFSRATQYHVSAGSNSQQRVRTETCYGPQIQSSIGPNRRDSVAPWEAYDIPTEAYSTLKSSTGQTKKLKRLSYKLGRK